MASGIGTIANLQGKVNADNELVVSATVSASGGAIADGVTASLKATVLDLTSANPLTVAITDGNGDQITSFGGGTQYAQGTASTDTDTATMAGVVRKDTPAIATGVIDGDRKRRSGQSGVESVERRCQRTRSVRPMGAISVRSARPKRL